jgi:hypothetical protein
MACQAADDSSSDRHAAAIRHLSGIDSIFKSEGRFILFQDCLFRHAVLPEHVRKEFPFRPVFSVIFFLLRQHARKAAVPDIEFSGRKEDLRHSFFIKCCRFFRHLRISVPRNKEDVRRQEPVLQENEVRDSLRKFQPAIHAFS